MNQIPRKLNNKITPKGNTPAAKKIDAVKAGDAWIVTAKTVDGKRLARLADQVENIHLLANKRSFHIEGQQALELKMLMAKRFEITDMLEDHYNKMVKALNLPEQNNSKPQRKIK